VTRATAGASATQRVAADRDAKPDPWAWLGMAIIAPCGAATAWLNVRSAQRAHRIIPATSADIVAD